MGHRLALDGTKGMLRGDDNLSGGQRANENDTSIGLERQRVRRGGLALNRLPLEK